MTLLPVSGVLLSDQVLGYEATNDSTNTTNTSVLHKKFDGNDDDKI